MVVRKTGVILLGLLVGLFLVVASWPYLSYSGKDIAGGITGNSIGEAIGTFYETSSINQRIFILAQILLLIIIIVAVFIVVGKFRKKEILSKTEFSKQSDGKRSHTDLDILYEMLKSKKEISMEDVEGTFNVGPDIALGWSKVLEGGDLAELDYPRFGNPVLRLVRDEGEKIKDEDKQIEVSTKNADKKIKKKTKVLIKKKKIVAKIKEKRKITKKKINKIKKINKRKVKPKKKIAKGGKK